MAVVMVKMLWSAEPACPVNVCLKLVSQPSPSPLQCRYSPVLNVGCVNEQVHLINCQGQHSTTWTGVFPCGVLWNSLTWITWPLWWGLPRCWPAGHPSPSLKCAHARTPTHARSLYMSLIGMWPQPSHTFTSDDVIKALMRDYSDITGNAAKLNLLASPCAFACVKSERPLGQVVHGVSGRSLLIHTVTPPCQCTSEAQVGPPCKKNSDVG